MSGKIRFLTVALLLAGAQTVSGNGLFDFGGLKEAEKAALQCELQGKWKQIHWRGTMDEAMADAAKTQKPIMVALVVGKKGEKNAKDC
jgi:hypothetical protein